MKNMPVYLRTLLESDTKKTRETTISEALLYLVLHQII